MASGGRRQRSLTWRAWGAGAALGLAAGLAASPASAAPKLTVEKTRLEIGSLVAGQTAEVEFPLANTGTEPLKILQVSVSCGCVTTSYPETLKPGEKGALKVKLVSYPLWNGPVEKHITVMSNDPEQPTLEMQLVAQIRPLFRFQPQNPLTLTYKKADVIRQVFTITAAVDPPVSISGVQPGGPGTEARLLPAEKGDGPGVWRVEVTVRPPQPGSDFSSFVTLQTTDPNAPTLPIIVNGIGQNAITIGPSVLYMAISGADPSAVPPRMMAVFRRGGTFRVLEVKPDSPALKAEFHPIPGAAYWEIVVHYAGGWTKGKRTGKIQVTTDDPETPKLEVPYEATVE